MYLHSGTLLFNFEQGKLKNIHSEYNFVAKSVDDSDKNSSNQRPRGYGGACILWKKNISAIKLPDGYERTVLLQLDNRITIINTYLPCRGKCSNEETADEIDQLNEICICHTSFLQEI